MHPPDCPYFEYEDHPRRKEIAAHVAEVVIRLRTGDLDTRGIAADSRPVHRKLFRDVTPRDQEYYAGHYRGESFRCLREYEVGIPADPRVGYASWSVQSVMGRLATEVLAGLAALDVLHGRPRSQVRREEKLYLTTVLACRFFEFFLRIHPYANGNGHAARFVVWAIFGRYGYWPRRWPIDPRPPDPPYTALITEYRNGNPVPLESFMVATLLNK
jgi:fido (protein-threonine AMPylation protein)